MEWVVWVVLGSVAAVVAVLTALVALGRLDPDPMSPPTSTLPPLGLPERPTSEDVDPVRIGTTLYGYAPAEVDVALDARRDRLAEQERALAAAAPPEGHGQRTDEHSSEGPHVHHHP